MSNQTMERPPEAARRSGRDASDAKSKFRRHTGTAAGARDRLVHEIRLELLASLHSAEWLLVRPLEAIRASIRIMERAGEVIDADAYRPFLVAMMNLEAGTPETDRLEARITEVLNLMLNARKRGELKSQPLFDRELGEQLDADRPKRSKPARILRSNGEALSLRQSGATTVEARRTGSAAVDWRARMDACKSASDARELFVELEAAIERLMVRWGIAPLCGEQARTGFSCVKKSGWKRAIAQIRETAGDGEAAELDHLVNRGFDMHGEWWQMLLAAEQKAAWDEGVERLEREPETPEKPAGQSLTWHQWRQLVESGLHRRGIEREVKPEGELLALFNGGWKPAKAVADICNLNPKSENKSPALTAAQHNLLNRMDAGRIIRWVPGSHGGSFRECWSMASGGKAIEDANLKERSVRLLTAAGLVQKIEDAGGERWEITDAGRASVHARTAKLIQGDKPKRGSKS